MDCRQNLVTWRIFFSLARTGSVTQTANELGCSGAEISKAVYKLERSFNLDLFDRKQRPFKLTENGKLLVKKVKPSFQCFVNSINDNLNDHHDVLIRVMAPIDLSIEFIPEQLRQYTEIYQNIHIDLSLGSDVKALLEGRVDVALLQRPKLIKGLIIRPCITCSSIPLASPEYLAKYGVPSSPEDLRGHTGILLRWNNSLPTSCLYDATNNPSPLLHWKRVFVTDNQITMKYLALKHLGITLDLAPSNAIDEIQNGQLVPILTEWRRENWDLCVVTRSDEEANNYELQKFASWWASIESKEAMARMSKGNDAVEKCLQFKK